MKVAVVQTNAGPDVGSNLQQALQFLSQAIESQAQWVLFPEVFLQRAGMHQKQLSIDTVQADTIPSALTAPFQEAARQNHIWILLGSLHERLSDQTKLANTSVMINPNGDIAALYRKMHLFDVQLKHRALLESETFLAGETPALLALEGQQVGLAICYDLRFPELFRYYASKQAHVLCVPSSFTFETGRKHWKPLLQARAIENQAFVLAPNQVGWHAQGVQSYGHSLIVAPDGEILAEADGDNCGVITADLDWSFQERLRQNFPCLQHAKMPIEHFSKFS